MDDTKRKGREGGLPQTRAHQVIQDGWQTHLPYAQTTKEKKKKEKEKEKEKKKRDKKK